jgi:protein required for attachment to host cells
MSTLWIVVADSGSARIYEAKSLGAPWQLVSAQGTAEERAAERRRAATVFAKRLAEHLERHVGEGDGRIALVAAPRFLQLLRDHLPLRLASLVTTTLERDLTTARPEEIAKHLAAR